MNSTSLQEFALYENDKEGNSAGISLNKKHEDPDDAMSETTCFLQRWGTTGLDGPVEVNSAVVYAFQLSLDTTIERDVSNKSIAE